jgi:hypothetical protein
LLEIEREREKVGFEFFLFIFEFERVKLVNCDLRVCGLLSFSPFFLVG